MTRSALLVAAALIACQSSADKDADSGGIGTDPSPTGAGTTPAGTTTGTTPAGTTPTGTTPTGTTPTGTTPTGTTPTGGTPAACPDEPPRGYDARIRADCSEPPRTGALDWVEEWRWEENTIHPGHHQVMVMPAVGPMVDTNGDGIVDESDTPGIVFSAFEFDYRDPGAVIAIDGGTGEILWSVLEVDGHSAVGSAGVALGDLDGTGQVVVVGTLDGLMALDARDGSLRWFAPTPVGRHGLPTLVDLEGDGLAEVVFGATVVESDGTIRWTGEAAIGGRYSFNGHAADLDGDGLLEVIAGATVYEHDGSVRWRLDDEEGLPLDGFTAAADLDGDGELEIVLVREAITLLDTDGTELWSVPYEGERGGPPVVADVDGDGLPEIGAAFLSGYRTFEADGTPIWTHPWGELGGENGSAVFDLDGDGVPEILTVDQENLYVFDGVTHATELLFSSFSSGTLYEYPVPVDADGDGSVELVVPMNDYSRFDESTGIALLGPAEGAWPAARKIWNQHYYQDGVVGDDGRVPAVAIVDPTEVRSGDTLEAIPLLRPNLTLGREELCLDECDDNVAVLWLPVEHTGLAASEPCDLVITSGADELARWAVPAMAPGEVVWVGPLEVSRDAWGGGITASVDADEAVNECDEGDNITEWDSFPCL
ncbi:MAG: hypothetical protein ACI9K2_003682 [Myxococcota bacterium]|jgi:hypothetical protein